MKCLRKLNGSNCRKTHCYFTCPICKKSLRVPKGKGKIERDPELKFVGS